MSQTICIFAEVENGRLLPSFAELLTAARELQKNCSCAIAALTILKKGSDIVSQIEAYGVDEIYAAEYEEDPLLKDDASSKVLAEIVRQTRPFAILVSASPTGRSIFSRLAYRLNVGLTADCTELIVKKREDGSRYICQNKPSFGDNIYVSIVMKEGVTPQIMTIRPGVYLPAKPSSKKAGLKDLSCIPFPKSQIKVLEIHDKENYTESITAAEAVVVAGKGVEAPESLARVRRFADTIGAAVGCTRPLADSGLMPFERQIGQTGVTVHPKICISLGVSGAIQHTEGIKDADLYLAINTDPEAAIFHEAQYGMAADANEVLKAYLDEK